MANDGSLNFDTKIDSSGFQDGVNALGSVTTKALGSAVAGITALGGAAVKVGSDFEAGMSQVQAVSGAAGEDLDRLKEKAKEMGAKTKFSATESAEAMNYMAMAGWKTEEMLGGIEGIMNLAAASGEDLATTSDIVTDALTAFGMEAKDAGDFADILAAASSNANTNVSMLGESFKYVAPVAGSLGYSAEDTAIALGLMANSGIKASQSGTQLRASIANMVKPTDDMDTIMNMLGISITNSDGSMKSLGDTMDMLRDRFKVVTEEQKNQNYAMREAEWVAENGADVFAGYTEEQKRYTMMLREGQYQLAGMTEAEHKLYAEKLLGIETSKKQSLTTEQYTRLAESLGRISFEGLTESQQSAYAATLFGKEAMSGMLAIINASEKDYQKLTDSIYNCKGAAEEMAEIMQDNLQGELVILQSGLEGLGVSLYETMQDTAKDVVKEAQGMVQQLQDAFDEGGFEGLVGSVGSVLAQVVQGIAGAAPSLIDAAVNLVSSFCEGLRNAPGIGESGAGLIMSLIGGILSCAGELWLTAMVLMGRLAEGLVSNLPQITSAGVNILNKLAEGIAANLPALIPAAMQALMVFSGSLRENVGLLMDAGLNLIMTLAQSLIDNLPVFIETVPTIITNIAGIINDNAPKLLTAGIELLSQLAMGLIEAVPALIANIPQIIQAIVSTFTAFNWISLGQNIIKVIADGIKSLAASIPGALKNIGQTAIDWMRAVNWHTLGADIIDLITIGIKSLLTAIPELLRSIGNTAVETFKSIDWLDVGANVIKGIISGITGALDGLWSAVGHLCSGLLDGVKSFFGINSPSTLMAEQGNFLVQGMINGLMHMPDELARYLDETVAKVIQWGQQMLTNAQSSAQNFVATTVVLIATLPGRMWTWLVNTVTKVAQWGQQILTTGKTVIGNMISAMISHLSQLPGKVTSELSKVTSGMVQWGADIVSRMTDVGKNIVTGIWDGISGGWDWLKNKVADLANSLLDAAKDALDINSPSGVFRDEFGRWLMPGAMEGVKRSMPKVLRDMKEQAGELLSGMRGMVNASLGEITLNASGAAGAKALTTAGTVVYADNSMKQENNYHVPVATPAETNKAQREAFRRFAGGVK